MSWGAALAIYFIIWWLVLFAVMPFGVRSQIEAGEVVHGTEQGAPHRHRMVRNAVITTVVAGIIFGLYYVNYVHGFLTLEDIPFFPRLREL